MILPWLPSFFGAAFLSALLVAVLRRGLAPRYLMDHPNERSSHVQPTPRGGGLGIVLVTLAGWLGVAPLLGVPWQAILAYAGGAALIAAVSGVDDLRPLPNRIRFAAHSGGALLAVAALGFWRAVEIPLLGALPLGWLGLPLTVVWIVGLTNAYNFMDGIDGLAGTQALIAGAAWTVGGAALGFPAAALLGLLLAASALGFLLHNWPPARIFMGDVGSAFLGYSFAVLPLVAAPTAPRLPVLAALLLWPFLFDSSFTFLRRLRRGENVFAAHRSHLYQRLVIAGHPHRRVTLGYAALALAGVLLAGLWLSGSSLGALTVATALPLLSALLWHIVRVQEAKRPFLLHLSR